MKKIFRLSILPLIISIVFASIWVFIGGLVYNSLIGRLYAPLLISIYITGLALTLFLSIIISNSLCKNAKPRNVEYKKTFIVIGAIFLCSILFEFLYELNPIDFKLGKPTSYIFLIDDSGSMSSNDPNYMRNDSIYNVMQDCDDNFPYAIYSFSDECKQILPMVPAASAQQKNYGFESSGGTDIQGAIQYVLNDINTGVLQAGESPRILLLSDGLSFYDEYRTVIKDCINNNISISTIGFGEADKYFLQLLAEDTRGAFVWIDDINQLTNAMNTAATSYSNYSRDLLGYRPYVSNDTLFSVLRIVFLLILAIGFVLIKVFMFSTFDEKNIALYTFIVFAILGAVAPEIGINGLRYDDGYIRAIMCVCFLLLLGSSKEPEEPNMGNVKSSWNNSVSNNMGGGFSGESDKWKF